MPPFPEFYYASLSDKVIDGVMIKKKKKRVIDGVRTVKSVKNSADQDEDPNIFYLEEKELACTTWFWSGRNMKDFLVGAERTGAPY